jgi:hypothetical protein
VAVGDVEPHRVYAARVTGLAPGEAFEYRVSRDGRDVFQSRGQALPAAGRPHRFVVFGDCGTTSVDQKAVAFRAFGAKPDFVMIPGDIVYDRGRVSEYREKFWPIYNADEPSPSAGAPLLRSTLFVSAPGNHDIATRDLDKYPDTMAYYLFWYQPLNGPVGAEGGPLVPKLTASEAHRKAFTDAAGERYPRMANFSFDYGGAHWTVLDANPYVDWSDPGLRSWVARDLASARGAAWRFVSFHHPGFNSAKKHFDEQQMRRLAPVFEEGGVDVVFNGHVHNYQRSYPLRFSPAGPDAPKPEKPGHVPGRWALDKGFDGQTRTRPDGVIYVVTGAGGASLYNPEQQDDQASWQEFTHKFISKVHSFTVADVNGPTLTVRQVSATGEELDRFTVTK